MAQPLNATFFAFRKRERGGVLTAASLAYVVVGIGSFVAFVALNIATLGPFFTWYMGVIGSISSGNADSVTMPTAMPAGMGLLMLSLLLYMFVAYVLLAAYEAACLRWMIRGETGGLFGLSLGADTWRVYGTYWVWFFLYIAFSLVVSIVFGAVMAGVAMAMQDPIAVLGVSVVSQIIQTLLMIYFGVRLAPAAAVSVGRQKFSFFSAWTVTRGRFWALFGSYFLIGIIFCVISVVVLGVAFGAALGPSLPSLLQLGPNPDQAQISALMSSLFTPQNLIVLCVGYALLLVFGLLIYVLTYGVNARAVVAAAEEGRIDGLAVAETFA